MKPQIQHLSRLPKAARWTSINGGDQLPGLVVSLFGDQVKQPYSEEQKDMGYGKILDPGHPAAKLKLNRLPFFRAPAIGVNIYPVALLTRFARPYGQLPFLTWSERVQKAREEGFTAVRQHGRAVLARKVDGGGPPQIYTSAEQVYPKNLPVLFHMRRQTPKGPCIDYALRAEARRVPMAHANSTSKKRVGALAFVRTKVAKKLMAALHLITTRGAYVVDYPEGEVPRRKKSGRGRLNDLDTKPKLIKFDEEKAGTRWSMQGWTYIFYHTSAMYAMPLTELIPQVRACLEKVNGLAKKMDNAWLAEALLHHKPPPQRPAVVFPGPTPMAVPGIDPKSPELQYKNTSVTQEVKPTVSQPPRLPPPPTGRKPQDVWAKELMAGIELLKEGQKSSQQTP